MFSFKKFVKSFLFILVIISSILFSQTFEFTTCSSNGGSGPTQSDCNSAYLTNGDLHQVIVNQGIQEWTVPFTGEYIIHVLGAQGGGSPNNSNGGKGASMQGTFLLNAGEVLKILVGQKGSRQTDYGYYGGGGGGGTFVATIDNSPLIVAGGGGGKSNAGGSYKYYT